MSKSKFGVKGRISKNNSAHFGDNVYAKSGQKGRISICECVAVDDQKSGKKAEFREWYVARRRIITPRKKADLGRISSLYAYLRDYEWGKRPI